MCAVRWELTNMKLVPNSKKDTATAPWDHLYESCSLCKLFRFSWIGQLLNPIFLRFRVLNTGSSQEWYQIDQNQVKPYQLFLYAWYAIALKGLKTDVEIDLGLELCARSCAEAVILRYGAVPYQVSPDQNYKQKSCLKGHGREGGQFGQCPEESKFR